MSSRFVDHFTQSLASSCSATPSPSPRTHTRSQLPTTSAKKAILHNLFLSLTQTQHPTPSLVSGTLETLLELDNATKAFAEPASDPEEEALKHAIIGKLVVNIYAESLDAYLTQATEVEAEAEWWADIERSRRNVAWYLLQTFPSRLTNLIHTILQKIRARELPFRLSLFTPSSLQLLFPSSDVLRPSALTTAIFPHLSQQPFSIVSSAFLVPLASAPKKDDPISTKITGTIYRYIYLVSTYLTFPLELTRQECKHNRRELEKIRDERAKVLGTLAQLRGPLGKVIEGKSEEGLKSFLERLNNTVSDVPSTMDENLSPLYPMFLLAITTLPSQIVSHERMLVARRLLRPSRWVLVWPKLLLLPPLALYGIKYLYASRATLHDFAVDAKETAEGFVKGWLIEPIKEVLKTVRAGGEAVLVHREGVAADLDSLERMSLSLARDELHYDSAQLAELSQRIRVGDLTPILEIYEADIRRPVRSAVSGTLLRSVFIQIQKAKVDIDQALAGIDKLLKSQELTFAFVGVAPALAIVYLAGGALGRVYGGAQGRGRYGGVTKRKGVLLVMRRIERLLNQRTPLHQTTLSPLSTGLLLLSVARLRQFADTALPSNSRLYEGFLEDVGDLEDPELGRDAKFRVVERMWRCWGGVLGWHRVVDEGGR